MNPFTNYCYRECQTLPTFLERLLGRKPSSHPELDILGVLQKLFVKILLLQAMKDISIYAKTIKAYFSKKLLRKSKDPLAIHVMGKLSDIMLGNLIPTKYGDLGNQIMIVKINEVDIPKVLVDLVATINIVTFVTIITFSPQRLKPTPTVVELAYRSTIKLVEKLEDITILVDSWQYHVNLLVLHTHSPECGKPFILGRPWLLIVYAYIRCRY